MLASLACRGFVWRTTDRVRRHVEAFHEQSDLRAQPFAFEITRKQLGRACGRLSAKAIQDAALARAGLSERAFEGGGRGCLRLLRGRDHAQTLHETLKLRPQRLAIEFARKPLGLLA